MICFRYLSYLEESDATRESHLKTWKYRKLPFWSVTLLEEWHSEKNSKCDSFCLENQALYTPKRLRRKFHLLNFIVYYSNAFYHCFLHNFCNQEKLELQHTQTKNFNVQQTFLLFWIGFHESKFNWVLELFVCEALKTQKFSKTSVYSNELFFMFYYIFIHLQIEKLNPLYPVKSTLTNSLINYWNRVPFDSRPSLPIADRFNASVGHSMLKKHWIFLRYVKLPPPIKKTTIFSIFFFSEGRKIQLEGGQLNSFTGKTFKTSNQLKNWFF